MKRGLIFFVLILLILLFNIAESSGITIKITGKATKEFSINITAVPGTADTPPGGGSGGGRLKKPPKGVIIKKYYDFLINKKIIEVKLIREDSTKELLLITNDENISQSFTLTLSPNLKKFISLSENNFVIESHSSKDISLNFITDLNSKPSVHTGTLKIKTKDKEKEVLIVFTIEELEEKKSLFDIILSIDDKYRELAPGDELVLNVTITNLGDSKSVKIPVIYTIKDFKDNIIISKKDKRTVETTLSFSKALKLPFSIKDGDYIVIVEIRSSDLITSSSLAFSSIIIKVKKLAYILLEFEHENGNIFLINRSLEKGRSQNIIHNLNKEYEVILFSDEEKVLYISSFNNPSHLHADDLDLHTDDFTEEENDGGLIDLKKTKFYITLPESRESNKVEIFKQGEKIFKEEIYDVGAKSCRLK